MKAKLLPALVLIGLVLGWELLVRAAGIPAYTLPAPSLVLTTLSPTSARSPAAGGSR